MKFKYIHRKLPNHRWLIVAYAAINNSFSDWIGLACAFSFWSGSRLFNNLVCHIFSLHPTAKQPKPPRICLCRRLNGKHFTEFHLETIRCVSLVVLYRIVDVLVPPSTLSVCVCPWKPLPIVFRCVFCNVHIVVQLDHGTGPSDLQFDSLYRVRLFKTAASH